MSSDFRSKQIRTTQLIASGTKAGVATHTAGYVPSMLVYSASKASNADGAYDSNMLKDASSANCVGSDVWLLVSGSTPSQGIGGTEGTTLFVGDVYISGSLGGPAGSYNSGWTDDGSTVRLTTTADKVGIGTTSVTSGYKLDIVGNTRIEGDLKVTGDYTQIHTDASTTESWTVTNDGTATAVTINQNGSGTTYHALDINVGGSPAFVVKNDKRVGIGIDSPDTPIHLKAPVPEIRLTDSDTNAYSGVQSSDGNLEFYADDGGVANNSTITFQVDNSEKVRIQHDGKVGIGTTSPSDKLTVDDGNVGIKNNNTDPSAPVTGQLRFYDVDNSHYVGFQAPTVATNPSTIWTLPTDDGSAGDRLETDGNGVLSWGTGAASSIVTGTPVTTDRYWLKIAEGRAAVGNGDTIINQFLVNFVGNENHADHAADRSFIVSAKYTAQTGSPYIDTDGTQVTVEMINATDIKDSTSSTPWAPNTDIVITVGSNRIPELWIRDVESHSYCYVTILGGTTSTDPGSYVSKGWKISAASTPSASPSLKTGTTYGKWASKRFSNLVLENLEGSNVDSNEILQNTGFPNANNWNTGGAQNGWTHGSGAWTYAHHASPGNLSQNKANMVSSGAKALPAKLYKFKYTISGVSGSPTARITNASFAHTNTPLPISNGTHTVYFRSKGSSAGGSAADDGIHSSGFVIQIVSSSAGNTFTIDDVSLKRVLGGDLKLSGRITTPDGDPAIELDMEGNLHGEQSIYLKEQTASNTDLVEYGQIWVKKIDDPNETHLYFTREDGTDIRLDAGADFNIIDSNNADSGYTWTHSPSDDVVNTDGTVDFVAGNNITISSDNTLKAIKFDANNAISAAIATVEPGEIVVGTNAAGKNPADDSATIAVSAGHKAEISVRVGGTTAAYQGNGTAAPGTANQFNVDYANITAYVIKDADNTTGALSMASSDSYAANIQFKNSAHIVLQMTEADLGNNAQLTVSAMQSGWNASNADPYTKLVMKIPVHIRIDSSNTVTQNVGIIVRKGKKGDTGTNGKDGFIINTTNNGVVALANVAANWAVTNSNADFVEVYGDRQGTAIQYLNKTDGAEGTTNDRFALDIETNGKVIGTSYSTTGVSRNVYSKWFDGAPSDASYLELRDTDVSGQILAKVYPSNVSPNAKLLVKDVVTQRTAGGAVDLHSIHVKIPVDAYVNSQAVDDYKVPLVIVKSGKRGADGAGGSAGSPGADGKDAWVIHATKRGVLSPAVVDSAGAVTIQSAVDHIAITGKRANTAIEYNSSNNGTEGTTADKFALKVTVAEDVAGTAYATDGTSAPIYSYWNSNKIKFKHTNSSGVILAQLEPELVGGEAKLKLVAFATELTSGKPLKYIELSIKVDAFVNGAAVTDHIVKIILDKTIPGADGANGSNGSNGSNGTNGTDAHYGWLSNSSPTVAAANDGTGYNLTSAGGTFHRYLGAVDKTGANSTYYTGTSGTNVAAVQNGLTFTITQSTGVYALTGGSWTTDSETFTVRAIVSGVTITKKYTITKAKMGAAGASGGSQSIIHIDKSADPSLFVQTQLVDNNGPDGQQTATIVNWDSELLDNNSLTVTTGGTNLTNGTITLPASGAGTYEVSFQIYAKTQNGGGDKKKKYRADLQQQPGGTGSWSTIATGNEITLQGDNVFATWSLMKQPRLISLTNNDKLRVIFTVQAVGTASNQVIKTEIGNTDSEALENWIRLTKLS
tara:strand:+ start:17718 stop:22847 length:5130 start_codon:yes stop_codon:yes gene_type:complete